MGWIFCGRVLIEQTFSRFFVTESSHQKAKGHGRLRRTPGIVRNKFGRVYDVVVSCYDPIHKIRLAPLFSVLLRHFDEVPGIIGTRPGYKAPPFQEVN